MIVKRLMAPTAACLVGFAVVLVGGCSSSSKTATPAVDRIEQHNFTGTTRSKTFEIDQRAYSTGRGNVSAVGLVDLRIGDESTRSGARTGFGKFAGSPLR